jgi:uncharacterized protein (TIGR03382 family)
MTSTFSKAALAAAAVSFATASFASGALVPIPNGDFELGSDGAGNASTFAVAEFWQEDQPRALSGQFGFANSGTVGTTAGLEPSGDIMGRLAVIGDADSATSFIGTMSTTSDLGVYTANTDYTLTFDAARDSFVGQDQWFVLGGLRADGVDVAGIDVDIRDLTNGSTTGAEDTFYEVVVTFSTADVPSVVGQDIAVYLGFRHDDNFNKTLYFDNVTLDATVIPEPGLAGLGLASLGLLLRRRK